MRSMLIISFVEWAGAFQRPQHMAIGFAQSGWGVTYASPGYVHRRGLAVESGVDLPENLTVVSPPALPGSTRLGAIARANVALMSRSLRALRRDPWDVIIFNDPRWSDTAAALPADLRIFDGMDDLSAMAHSAQWAQQMETRAIETADRIFTGTWMMADRLKSRHDHVTFIPCGVDAELFGSPDPAAIDRCRADLRGWFGQTDAPLAGYFGALNERIDTGQIRALIDAGWRVLLIGPHGASLPPLPEHPNLKLCGPRPYADLPAWLATFDLALIPYRTDGPQRFLYPVKALEYLAGGKPVLSSSLPDVERFLSEYLHIADPPEAWADLAENWADRKPDLLKKTEKGRAYANSRKWSVMISEMSEHIDGA